MYICVCMSDDVFFVPEMPLCVRSREVTIYHLCEAPSAIMFFMSHNQSIGTQ